MNQKGSMVYLGVNYACTKSKTDSTQKILISPLHILEEKQDF